MLGLYHIFVHAAKNERIVHGTIHEILVHAPEHHVFVILKFTSLFKLLHIRH